LLGRFELHGNVERYNHRRRTVGARGAAAPDSGKAIIFRAKARFFGQKPAAKSEQKYFLYLLNEKTEFIPSSKIKCPKSGIFLLIITRWGESGKVILQVSIAVCSGAVKKIFRAKMAQPP